jgi:hypothetical protein
MSKAETSLEHYEGMPLPSLHALSRLRQRGLREADLDRLQRHGEEFDDGYLMSNRTIDEHITQLKSEIQRLERLKGVVLIEQDNTLVTVYRSNRRRQRRILGGRARHIHSYKVRT